MVAIAIRAFLTMRPVRVRADGGSLDIVCAQERILKIFQITGLDKVFGLHESVEAARAAQA